MTSLDNGSEALVLLGLGINILRSVTLRQTADRLTVYMERVEMERKGSWITSNLHYFMGEDKNIDCFGFDHHLIDHQ